MRKIDIIVILIFTCLFLSLCVIPIPDGIAPVDVSDTTYDPFELHTPSAVITNYVDATQTTTYGTITNGPPNGMGVDDNTYTTLTEASFSEVTYYTLASVSFTGGIPGGWTVSGSYSIITSGGQSGSYLKWGKPGGSLTSPVIDLTGSDGWRVSFYWKSVGIDPLGSGALKLDYSTNGGLSWTTDWTSSSSPTTWTQVIRSFTWIDSDLRIRWVAAFTGTYQAVGLDTILWQYYDTNTYYRFEAVFRFDSVTYTYPGEYLTIDFDSASSSETLNVYGGTSSNPTTLILSGIAGNVDQNVSISTTLTSSPYYVKIADVSRSGDTSQSAWKICRMYIKSVSRPPTITEAGVIADLYNRWFAGLYTSQGVNVTISDEDGHTDIESVRVGIDTNNNPADGYELLYLFTHSSASFSELEDVNDICVINTTTSYYSTTTTTLTCVFYLEFNWNTYPFDGNTFDFCYIIAYDVSGSYCHKSTSSGEVTMISKLIISSFIVKDDMSPYDIGNIDSAIRVYGYVFYNSAIGTVPSFSTIDIYISATGCTGSPWQASTMQSSGYFSMTVFSPSTPSGSYTTYTAKVVPKGTGFFGPDLLITTVNDTYRGERILVDLFAIGDDGINVVDPGEYVTVEARLKYEGSGETVTSATGVKINNNAANFASGTQRWYISHGHASVSYEVFNTVTVDNSGLSVTTLRITGSPVTVYWERLEVRITAVNDAFTIYGSEVTFTFVASFYTTTTSVSGTVTFNSTYVGTVTDGVGTVRLRMWEYGNFTLVATSCVITGTHVNQVVVLTSQVWAFWDCVSSDGFYTYWQYISDDEIYLRLYPISIAYWVYNSTMCDSTYFVETWYDGETGPSFYLSSVGEFPVIIFGPVNYTWSPISVVINMTWHGHVMTILSETYYVPSGLAIEIQYLFMSMDNQYVNIYITTTWGNACITVWDNSTIVKYMPYEGWMQIRKSSVVGLHNLTILVNGTHAGPFSGQWMTFEIDYGWLWLNIVYEVESTPLVLDVIWTYGATDTRVFISGSVTMNCHIYVYEDNVLKASGTIVAGSFFRDWMRQSSLTPTDVQVGVLFINGSQQYWANFTYAQLGLEEIALDYFTMSQDSVMIYFYIKTNWRNATITIWDNDTLVLYMSHEGWVNLRKSSTIGLHNLTILINGTHSGACTGQYRSLVIDPRWVWLSVLYEVTPVTTLEVTWNYGASETRVFISGSVSISCNIYIYEDNILTASGSLNAGAFFRDWTRQSSTSPTDIWVGVLFVSGAQQYWANFTYGQLRLTVLRIESLLIYHDSMMVYCHIRTSWENTTVYVCDNGVPVGSFPEGHFFWYRSGVIGLHILTLNVTSGTSYVTVESAYYVPRWGDTALAITTFTILNMQDRYTLITVTTNWQNCTIDVYLNDTRYVHNAIEGMINLTRPSNAGLYNLTIVVDGGTQSLSMWGWIRTTEEGVTYDYSQFYSGVQYQYLTTNVNELNPALYVDPLAGQWLFWSIVMLVLCVPLIYIILRIIRRRRQDMSVYMRSQRHTLRGFL